MHYRNPRVKSLVALAFAGNFIDTQYQNLSVTIKIVNSLKNEIAIEKTMHFIEASSANYY